MNVSIEPVKSTELSQLVEVSHQTFYDTFHQQNSEEDMQLFLKTSFSEPVLAQEILVPGNYFFFARIEGYLAGYLKLSTLNKGTLEAGALEISRIYVVKEKIGAGVGKALLTFAISFALNYHKTVLYLGVWEHNRKAISFYQNFGFKKIGEEKFLVGNDVQNDWVMSKRLMEG